MFISQRHVRTLAVLLMGGLIALLPLASLVQAGGYGDPNGICILPEINDNPDKPMFEPSPTPWLTVDYVVTPAPSNMLQFSTLSDALVMAESIGSHDGDNIVEICIEGGTPGTPIVYVDEVTVRTTPWTNVIYGTPTDPILIFSPNGAEATVFIPLNDRIIHVQGGGSPRPVLFKGLAFKDGHAQRGGAMHIEEANATLERIDFTHNRATGFDARGGAILAEGSQVSIQESKFSENSSEEFGGAISSIDGTVVIQQTFFNMNSADFGGGLQAENSNLNFVQNEFLQNQAEMSGGGVLLEDSSLFDQGTRYSTNYSNVRGGAIYSYNDVNPAQLVLSHTHFDGNTAQDGGAIAFVGEGLTVNQQTTFIGNSATQNGGSIAVLEPESPSTPTPLNQVVMQDSIIDGSNALVDGGGLFVKTGTLVATAVDWVNNHADGSGGAISTADIDVTLDGNEFLANTSRAEGGALKMSGLAGTGSLKVSNSVFSNNATQVNWADGGAIYLNTLMPVASITGTQFLSNHAGGSGGALKCYGITETLIDNAYFASNTADHNGGALAVFHGCDTAINASHFEYNQAPNQFGGAVFQFVDSNPPSGIFQDLVIVDSEFNNNHAQDGGALAANENFDWEIYTSDFIENSADIHGGAIYLKNKLTGSGLTFTGNSALRGGALAQLNIGWNGSVPISLSNALFNENSATFHGGGIYIASYISPGDRSLELVNSQIRDNWSGILGGGLSLESGSTLTLEGTAIVFNNAMQGDHAIHFDGIIYDSLTTISHSTIAGNGNLVGNNTAQRSTALNPGTVSIMDSIIAFNDAEEVYASSVGPGASITNTDIYDQAPNSIMSGVIEGLWLNGVANLSTDPLFTGNGPGDTNPFTTTNPATFDFSLQPGSPAIGMGAF